jgi:hypothetical protein
MVLMHSTFTANPVWAMLQDSLGRTTHALCPTSRDQCAGTFSALFLSILLRFRYIDPWPLFLPLFSMLGGPGG